MLPIKLLMPWPPSVNTLYFQGKSHGQKFMSKKGREYKQALHALYANEDRVPVKVPLKIRIQLYPPDRRDRDFDNYIKALLDGLKWLNFIEDDSLFTCALVVKHEKLDQYNKGLALIYITEDKKPNRCSISTIQEYFKALEFDETDMQLFHKPPKKVK